MRLLAVATMIALGGCSQAADDLRGVRSNEVLLQVSATGRADARPDEARLTIGVSNTGGTAAAASATNSTTMNAVVAALGRLGIAADDVQTRNVGLARISYGPQTGRYQAENLVEVRIRDVSKAGPAIAAATEAGGNVVAGPELRLASPEAANNAAYAAAYKAARARAQAYAEAAGMRVTRVLSIRDGAVEGMPVYASADARGAVAQAAAPPPPVQPGMSTREVRVNAEFALGR